MNNKILSIFICTLLIATATLPVVTSMNDEKMSSVKSVDNVYSENFILAQEDKMLTLGGDFPSSWTITEVVSTESNSFSWLASLAVDSAGMVHVAWQDLTNYNGSGTDYDIFYKCKPSGGSWPTTTEVVSTESTSNSGTPCLAVDSTGMVHVAWVDVTNYNGSGTDADIFYKSKSSGGSWPTTTEVVSTESNYSSMFPCLAVDSAGMVHVAWDDSTDYGGSGTDNDIFYKYKPNNPPSAPNITGPPSGRIGKEYCWDFHSNDTDGDIIKYIIDWGDGTTTETDCVEPCTPVKECHTYTKQGSYNITAIAKECEYGLESDESTFKVTIPRIRTVYHPLLVWFLERFPFLERLLGLIRVI